MLLAILFHTVFSPPLMRNPLDLDPPSRVLHAEMSMVQLIRQGHKEIDEIDDTLARAERIAHDTLDIGTKVSV